jgi:hypothetical protein
VCGEDIPYKLNKENAEKKGFPFAGFPVNIFEEEIEEGKIQQSPATPAQNLADPISNGCFVHHTNLCSEGSIFTNELINGEKHGLKGCEPSKSAFLNCKQVKKGGNLSII